MCLEINTLFSKVSENKNLLLQSEHHYCFTWLLKEGMIFLGFIFMKNVLQEAR